MELTSEQVYDSIIYGAEKVIENKEFLNRINVFPVNDGDTGSNLASMMRTIKNESEIKNSVKETIESISDAALKGARGNSGIIFAQYLFGLGEKMAIGCNVTIEQFVIASNDAVDYAYKAIDTPIEGTIITIMSTWGKTLINKFQSIEESYEIFIKSYYIVVASLDKTKEQLDILKKYDVVDSGAMGFTYFVEGFSKFLISDRSSNYKRAPNLNLNSSYETNVVKKHKLSEFRYCTECLIEGDSLDFEGIKRKLSNMGNSFVIAGNRKKCKIHIHTNKPREIYKYLYTKGTIVFQKVDDIFMQENVVKNRFSKIALITDSIADLSDEIIDKFQIQIINLNILHNNVSYIDKQTISPLMTLDLCDGGNILPTSSQPTSIQIENTLDYLSTYYDSIIVITVSSKLSGTYSNFKRVSEKLSKRNYKINIIDSKQDSGSQGLVVKKCAQYIKAGLKHQRIVELINWEINNSKILVQVKSLDNFIKSGRLSNRMGKLALLLNLKPIVSLDKQGQACLDSFAFSAKGSNSNIIKHIRKILKRNQIDEYNIVHVNNISEAKDLSNTLSEIIGFPPSYICETSSVVAISAGRGAVGVSYLLRKEVD